MKYLLILIIFSAFIAQTNAQNTVKIQGNFSTSNTNPVTLTCDQSISRIEVEVLDGSNNPVNGENVTASLATGTGTLSGTTTQTTNASGIATFDDLSYSENTDLTILFEDSGSTSASDTTKNISSIDCEVTGVWTNYNGFWASSETSINPVKPDNSHDFLAFTFNGINYSTGVDDAKLTNNGVTFESLNIRALPVASLPTGGGSGAYFIAFGQLYDGINNGVDGGITNPFPPITNGAEVAQYLTDGPQGLDLGTNVTNIPSGATSIFNLSSAGISLANINDGIPDIIVSQTAQPNSSDTDQLRFVDSSNNVVGQTITLNMTNEPKVGNWTVDFYEFDSNQSQNNFINTDRPIHFFAVDFADFGINPNNKGNAVALEYITGGSADPSFLAFNEPSLGVATQLTEISTANTQQNCDGTLPNIIEIQLEDQNGNAVAQSGLAIKATLETGPGSLDGTTTRFTDGSGTATFNDLEFTTGGNHKIKFSFADLDDAITANIADATGCDSFIWDGSESSAWNNPDNWATGTGNTVFPDGNNAVEIPDVSGASDRYPILNVDAGVGDLTMASGASIELNGFELALNGTLTGVTSGASIDASAPGSNLFISSVNAANIPADFISSDVSNFTVENSTGATVNSTMNITEVLDLREGTLTTGDHITMVCTFSPDRKTAQINQLDGTSTISGDVTVEQCFPARRAFRFVSSSTTTSTTIRQNWQEDASAWNNNPNPGFGTHITGVEPDNPNNDPPVSEDKTNGFDWQPSGNASMFTFSNDNNQEWAMIDNTDPNTLNAGEAFRLMIRGDRSINIQLNATAPTDTKLRSTGTIAKGPVSPDLSSIDATNKYALIGNPFHAIVDMKEVLLASTDLAQKIIVWDPTLGGTPTVGQPGGRGAFVTVDVTNNSSNNSNSEMEKFLQPYQAFFVEATGNSPTLTFEETNKSIDEAQVDVFSNLPASYIDMLLFDKTSFENNDTADDGLVIYFSSDFSNNFTDNDFSKFLNLDENLARNENNILISYEKRAMPEHNEILELHTSQYRTSDYVLQIEVGDFPENSVYLNDNYTGTETLLDNNNLNTFNFNVDQSIAESVASDRFEIRFDSSTFGIDDFEKVGISVYPNPVQDIVTLNLSQFNGKANQLTVFEVTGRLIDNYSFENKDSFKIDMSNYASGLYILKIETEKSVLQYKLIKK